MKYANIDLLRMNNRNIFLKSRWEGHTRIVEKDENFNFYFYILKEEEDRIKHFYNRVEKIEKNISSYDGREVIKVMLKQNLYKSEIDNILQYFTVVFESDVKTINKYIISKELEFDDNKRIIYLDIETDLCSNIYTVEEPITSIAIYDNFTNLYYNFHWRADLKETKIEKSITFKEEIVAEVNAYSNEVAMIKAFINRIHDISSDVMCGWFSNSFDMPYIINRCIKLGIEYQKLSRFFNVQFKLDTEDKNNTRINIIGCECVDLLTIYKKITYDNKPDNYRLSTVAKHILNDDKEQFGDVRTLWHNELDKLIQYNIKDVYLIVKLDAATKLIQYLNTIQALTYLPFKEMLIGDRVAYARLCDNYILKQYNGKCVFPDKKNNRHIDYEGALTLDSIPGRHKNIAVFDFASMYPSIYRTFNISPETIKYKEDVGVLSLGKFELMDLDDVKKTFDIYFDIKTPGLIPSILDNLIVRRKQIELARDKCIPGSIEAVALQNLQGGVKVIANTLYGAVAYKNFRIYNYLIPQIICAIGRRMLTFVKKLIEEKGFIIVAGDTDSVFVKIGDDLSKEEVLVKVKELEDLIEQQFKYFIKAMIGFERQHYCKMDCEKIFSNVIFKDGKKSYFGRLFWKKGKFVDEKFYRGFEVVRRDMPIAIKPFLIEIFEDILNGKNILETRNKLIKFKADLKNMKTWELGATQQIKKNLQDYSGNTMHIRAAKYSNEHLHTTFAKSDFPKILLVKVIETTKYPQTNVIALDENTPLPSEIQIDYDAIIAKYITTKLEMLEGVIANINLLYSNNTSLFEYIVNSGGSKVANI